MREELRTKGHLAKLFDNDFDLTLEAIAQAQQKIAHGKEVDVRKLLSEMGKRGSAGAACKEKS